MDDSFQFNFAPNQKWELFSGIGIGYNYLNDKRTINGVIQTNISNVKDVNINDTIYRTGQFPSLLTDLAFRFSVGTRYYFYKNLGVEINLGFGSYLVSGGIVYRF